jgi:predicted membrane protein
MSFSKQEASKWFGNACFIFGTVSMISVHAASVAITPWLIFLVGNIIWLYDSVRTKNWPWAASAGFFILWDALITASRIYGLDVLFFLQPIITIMEMLP